VLCPGDGEESLADTGLATEVASALADSPRLQPPRNSGVCRRRSASDLIIRASGPKVLITTINLRARKAIPLAETPSINM
jgi:hypothetical protein